MKYRKLGNTGLSISVISFGTMFYGGAQYQATDNPVTREEGLACLEKATASEINYIDCADIYGGFGPAEKIIGEFLKDYERSDFVISSKVQFPMSRKINDRGLSRKHIHESIDKTLKRLQTDYLDLYYCHRYDYSNPLVETVKAMNVLIDQGKILYWGTSNWQAAQLERAYAIASELGLEPPACDQVRYSMFLRYGVEVELPYTAEYTGLGVVAYKVLSNGILTGLYANKNLTEFSERDTQIFQYYTGLELNESSLEKLKQLVAIAKDLDVTLPQLAYSWCLHNPLVNAAIMSTRKPERIEENLQAITLKLEKETMEKISSVLNNQPEPNEFYYETFQRYKNYLTNHPQAGLGKFPPDPPNF